MSFDLSKVPTSELHRVDYVNIPGVYEASEWGKKFHALRVDEALGGGAAGGGKSLIGLHDAIPHVLVANELCQREEIRWGEIEDSALHLRRLSTGLDPTIRRAKIAYGRVFGTIDGKDCKFYEKDLKFVFRSGFQHQFGHCKDKDDWAAYYSKNFSHIFFDELREFEDEQYQHISSRARSNHPVLQRMIKVRAATNPGPGWVRKYFVDPSPKGGKILKRKLVREDGTFEWHTRIYMHATLFDNPDKAFVRDYERRLLARPAHIRDALLHGNWWVVVGAYFADHFRPDLHIIKPFRIPGDWQVFRSLDWGYKSKGVCQWWAVDPDGNLICIREWVFSMMDGTRVAQRIRDIEKSLHLWGHGRSKITGPADTNLWSEYSTTDSHAEKMAREGVHWLKADKRSRQMNAERLLTRLDDHGGGLHRPGIMWFDTCRESITTIPTIQSDKNDSDVPEKCDIDHACDAAQYACAYQTVKYDTLKKRLDSRKSVYLDEEEKEFAKEDAREARKDRGRLGYGANY